ncbi:glycosyltransferase [Candidatus Saccharibacteria bacterium]|nr:glycosyltransferase [Candidatus Saccharibacteria bacterium]
MKVALVCDWLTNVGGAEKVLLALHRMYPKAPIYTSQYSPKGIDWFLDADVRTGWLQIFPAGMRRVLGVFRQRWFSRLDLSEYDLVISVTGAEAKAVRATKLGAKHISYCHAPTQYYWQMYDKYVENPGFSILNPLVRVCFKALVKPLRRRDFEAAARVDQFVTISEYTKGLIAKYYKRDAVVVHPPVDVSVFGAWHSDAIRCVSGAPRRDNLKIISRRSAPSAAKSKISPLCPSTQRIASEYNCDYYITTSRQVNWKRIDLAVKACVKLGRPLVVIGEGPEHKKLVKMAEGAFTSDGSPLVSFLPLLGAEELAKYLAGAKGYLFPSMEPFGIAPVEALAAGCPVVALAAGGALDYIVDGVNGVLFSKQTVKSLCEGILKFEKTKFDLEVVSESAEKFGVLRFEKEMRKVVDEKVG